MQLKNDLNNFDISQKNYITRKLNALPTARRQEDIVAFADNYRVTHGAFPGVYSYSKTPYMREVSASISPNHSARKVVLMGANQIGKTAAVFENPLLFFTNLAYPTNVLYLTSTQDLVKMFVEERIEQMYKSHQVQFRSDDMYTAEPTKGKIMRKTGDTSYKKSGMGWNHVFMSYGSIKQVRSLDFQVVMLDEVDEIMTVESRHSQGDFVELISKRTRAYSGRAKIVLASTPLNEYNSIIAREYRLGTQKQYYVPCPVCGEYQTLSMEKLKWKYTDAIHNTVDPRSVHIECEHKQCIIKNEHKTTMLAHGQWRSHNKTPSPDVESYNISALYCPPGMSTLAEIAQEFIDAQGNASKLQVFTNLTLGQPFTHRSILSDTDTTDLKENYVCGEIPKKDTEGLFPIMTTIGADVQADRIEFELMGVAPNNHTWCIGYYVIEGDTSVHDAGAWEKLSDLFDNNKLPTIPRIVLIDAGYNSDVVHQFCNNRRNVYPCRGSIQSTIKSNNFHFRPLLGYQDYWRRQLIEINVATDAYKRTIYKNLLLRRGDDGHAPSGFCRFPKNITKKYFKGLQAERQEAVINKRSGKIVKYQFVNPAGSRNEPLDCRVYALCAVDAVAHMYSRSVGKPSTDWGLFWKSIISRREHDKNSKSNKS